MINRWVATKLLCSWIPVPVSPIFENSMPKTLKFSNGDELPPLGLGTWKAAPGEVGAAIEAAVRMGYRHVDCAAIYGNEAEIGETLGQLFRAGVVKREELWITSKLWNDAHAPQDVMPALEKTLRDLQLDYLDLYLIHWPLAFRKGVHFPDTPADTISLTELPLAETWAAMEKLAEKELCRHIGVANFSRAKLNSLLLTARRKPEMNQIELHPYLQQPLMLEFCRNNGIHLTAYAPLGSGGRPEQLKGVDEPVLLNDPSIAEIASRRGATVAQVLLQWGLARGTAVIPKSVNSVRLQENLAATELTLSSSEIAEINHLDRSRRYFGGEFWTMEGTDYTLASLWDAE